MLYFYVRGPQHRVCEVRLNPDGPGYELVVKETDDTRIERFDSLRTLREREESITSEWRADGWREPERLRKQPLASRPLPEPPVEGASPAHAMRPALRAHERAACEDQESARYDFLSRR